MFKRMMAAAISAVMLLVPMTAYAEGDGTGGGKDEALTVTAASVEDGATVGAEDSITLTFSKNVVNAKVKDTNMALFSLANSTGAEVEITVTMADDQVEPDKKNDVVITPASPLADGTYTLTAKAGITSKSGDVTAEDYTLTFTVGAGNADTGADTGTDTAVPQPDTGVGAEKENATSMVVPGVVLVVVVIVGAFLLTRKKK